MCLISISSYEFVFHFHISLCRIIIWAKIINKLNSVFFNSSRSIVRETVMILRCLRKQPPMFLFFVAISVA